METTCLHCENSFDSLRPTAKFCSNKCRASYNQNIRYGGVLELKIYALAEPNTDSIFYIGKTISSLQNRLLGHINDKEGNYVKRKIISDLKADGLLPIIIELEKIEVKNESEELIALAREDYWIKHYSKTHKLCNAEGIKTPFKPRLLSTYQKDSEKINSYLVRIEPDVLEKLECETGIKTPQKAVNFLFDFWVTNKNVNFEVLRRLENLQIIVGTPFVEKIEIVENIPDKPKIEVSEPIPPAPKEVPKKDSTNDNSGLRKAQLEIRMKKQGF